MTAKERIAENGKNVHIHETTGFSQSLPRELTLTTFEVGDTIVFPEKYIFGKNGNVFKQSFDKGQTFHDFVICKFIKSNGDVDNINIFPRTISRINLVYELDSNNDVKFSAAMPNKGTAVELMNSFIDKGTEEKTDLALAMDALVGKSIRITAKTTIKTQKWENGTRVNALRDAHVYTYDLVEDGE